MEWLLWHRVSALAIILLIVGFWLVNRLIKTIKSTLRKAKVPDDVNPFLTSVINVVLKLVLILAAAGLVGIQTASLVAVLAAAGFAVGMALQGSLGNFAAGVIVAIFRPYRVDDWVEIHEKFGKVESIQLFNTVITTPGRKTLIVPNGSVIDGVITNYSTQGYIRIELQVTMPYSEDFPRVKEIILQAIEGAPHVLVEPSPEVGIEQFDSHNILVAVRPYTQPDHYWDVHFEVYRRIKKAFYDANIKVAYSEGVEMGNIGR